MEVEINLVLRWNFSFWGSDVGFLVCLMSSSKTQFFTWFSRVVWTLGWKSAVMGVVRTFLNLFMILYSSVQKFGLIRVRYYSVM